MKSAMTFKAKSGTISIRLLWLMFTLLMGGQSFGQVTYRVGLDADNKTYRLYMKSAVAYTGNLAKISTAQMTVVVPHGTATNQFSPVNIQGKQVGVNQMAWGVSRVNAPSENLTADYISFGFSGSSSPIVFDMLAGQEIELLNFQNSGNCIGIVKLIAGNDPFIAPNSKNTNPGNQMTLLGFGFGNAYNGNYGSSVNCQSSIADLTVGITGAANITAGIPTNYSISVNNIGTGASISQISVATTLPAGVSYNSFSGAGWSVNAAPQLNGTTIVTATNSNQVAANASLGLLQINVTAGASIGNGNTISISSVVSGGGESNVSNNAASTGSNVAVNAPNLYLLLSGPSMVSPNTAINYTLNLSNIGTAASNGSISATLLLPAGLSYSSFSGNGWAYSSSTLQNGGAILLTFNYSNSIAINASASTLIINVNAGNNLTNNAVLAITGNVSGGGDNSPNNNSSTVNSTVVIVNAPNLSVNFVGSNNFIAGTSNNFTINISNTGLAATSGQIISTTTLPAGFIYNSFIGAGWNVVATPQSNGTTLITSTYNGSIPAGGAATPLVLNVTPQGYLGNGSSFTINTNVSGGGNGNTISGNFNVIITAPANLGLTILGNNLINAGTSGNYTFNLNNQSLTPSSGLITNIITLPMGVSYNSFTGNGWTLVNSAPQQNGTTLLTFTYNNIIAGNSNATGLVLNLGFASTLNANTTLTIVGNISGGGSAGSSNNIILTVIDVPKPDLTVSINGTTTTTPNGSATFTVNVNNIGNASSSGQISVSLLVPNGLTYTSFSGNGWTYGSSTLQNGGAILLTFTTNNVIGINGSSNNLVLNMTAGGNLTNNTILTINANVSGGGESNTSNNSISINTTILVATPNLVVNITGTNNFIIGTNNNFTININNTGVGASSGQIIYTTTLPLGFVYNSFTGTGWTVIATLQPNGTTLISATFNGIIPAGGSANPLILNVTPQANLGNGSSFTINYVVSGGGNANNISGTYIIIVNLPANPDLTITINGTTTTTPSGNATYNVTVNNIGNVASNGQVTVSVLVPNGLTYTSFTGNGWTYGSSTLQNGGAILLTFTTNTIINANSSSNILVINMIAGGNLSNNTILTINGNVAGGGETNTNNNSATINIIINTNGSIKIADLGVNVTTDNKTPNLGQVVNYTFTIINNGTGTPSNVQNQIILPPGFMITGFNSNAGSYNQYTGIWTIGNIPNGFTYTLTISGKPTIEGIDFATITIILSSLQDNVATNNIAKVCYATPVTLCAGEGFWAYLGKQNTNIKWFKNNTQLTNATADSLLITTTGSYSASYINSCGQAVTTPAITVTSGVAPNPPSIASNKLSICGTETAQLTASNCNGKVTWSTGATTSTITVNSAGTYTTTCTNTCGTSQNSMPFVLANNCQNIGQVGDFVWYDDNNNGKQDATELGVKGVILELFKDGISTGITTTTDNLGKYLFTNLSSGNYQVKIWKTSLPANYLLSMKSNAIGVADNLDSDFDFSTGLSPVVVINTSNASQSINLTIDGGIRLKPDAEISDPCKCFDVEYTFTEKKELFETVTVKGPKNEIWRVIQQKGMLALDSLVKKPVLIGTPLVEVSAGIYKLSFTHEDNIGYSVKVTNGEDTLSIANFCSVYPQVKATELGQTVCRNSPPIPLTVTMSIPGNAAFFYLDKITKQKVFITSFDPKKFTSGETIYIKIEVTPANGELCSYTLKQTTQISLIDCDNTCKPQICVPIKIAKTKR